MVSQVLETCSVYVLWCAYQAKELMLLQGKLSPQQPPVISLALTGFQYPNYLLPVITSDDCGIQDKSHFEESNTNALAVAISLQKKADSCLKVSFKFLCRI